VNTGTSGPSLQILPEGYAICRLAADAAVPQWAQRRNTSFTSVTRTSDELSILCPEEWMPECLPGERGWRGLRVVGSMDFNVTGVAAALTNPLAQAGIPLLLVATFDTDYVFVRDDGLHAACRALLTAGCRIEGKEHP